jgi:hypothetical protein
MKSILVGVLALTWTLGYGQASKARKDSLKTEKAKTSLYKKQPVWIAMHQDTAANYHEAVRAFKEYWKDRPQPKDELEGSEKEKTSLFRKIFEAGEVKKEKESEEYAFEYKKFNNWVRDNAPFVQPNGRMLTPNERMALWKQQRPQE